MDAFAPLTAWLEVNGPEGFFTDGQLQQAREAAEHAAKEVWARLGEAYLADPEGLRAQAPQAFALVEAALGTTTNRELGLVLAGLAPVPGVQGRRAAQGQPAPVRGGAVRVERKEGAGRPQQAQRSDRLRQFVDDYRMPPPGEQAQAAQGVVAAAVRALGDMRNAAVRHGAFTSDLTAFAAKYLPSAARYWQLVRKGQADRVRSELEIDRVMGEYFRLPAEQRRGADVPGTVSHALMRMTRAKAWGYRPAWLTGPDAQRLKVDEEMAQLWQALSPQAQKVVDAVLRHGHESIKALREQALASVEHELDAVIEDARRRGDAAALRRAEDAKLRSVSEFAQLAQLDTGWPYAPLKRFGSHVVVARSQALVDAEAVLEDRTATDAQRARACYTFRPVREVVRVF